MLLAALIFVYLMGAWMMWEDNIRDSGRGPDPAGAFYSRELQDWYDNEAPQWARDITDHAATVISVALWPFLIFLGLTVLVWRRFK